MKSGLRADLFANSLAITPPKTIAELKERAMRYINMEEVGETKKLEACQEGRKNDGLKRKQEK